VSDVAPGWHPDPADPQRNLRWWDGSSWTGAVQPKPVFSPPGLSRVPQRVLSPPSGSGMYQQNRTTVAVLGVVGLYLLLAAATHIVLLGIFPVSMSLRALRRREPFAFVAVAAAVVAVGVAISMLVR